MSYDVLSSSFVFSDYCPSLNPPIIWYTRRMINSSAQSDKGRNLSETITQLRQLGSLWWPMVGVGGTALTTLVSTEDAHADAPQKEISTSLKPKESEEINPYEVSDFTPSGKIPSSVILYQYEVCPFCCKVKAFLDYHNISYRTVEVNPLSKAEIKWSEYKKVPIILLDGSVQMNNSSSIISQLASDVESVAHNKKSKKNWLPLKQTSNDKTSSSDIVMWRRWVDEKFVRAITVNIYRNAKESFQTFDYITEHGNFSWPQRQAARIVGATMMWGISSRLKKKYDIHGDVREALYQLAEEWVAGLGDRPFMGQGDEPSLADIEAFGVMRSIVGTDTFMDLQHNTSIGPWYERMMKQVGDSSRIPE